MSTLGEARPAWGATSTAPASATDRWVVPSVAAVLWLFAAWPLFFVEILPHQDLSAHAAGAYVVDHISAYPEYAAAHGFRTNSALTSFVRSAAPWLGYLGAARAFLLAVLAVNAVGYTLLLDSLGGAKRVWIGGLFAVPFVHHWFVSMGMLNFSLSFGLCLWILSQQSALRERWSLDDFPSTRYVLEHRVPGQVVVGDEAGDEAELAELAKLGLGTVLFVPVICNDEPLALLEIYRVRPQAFTAREIDRARVLAHQLGAALHRLPT